MPHLRGLARRVRELLRDRQILRNDVGTHIRSLGQGGVTLDSEHIRSSVCELKPVLHGAPGWQLITAFKAGETESEANDVCLTSLQRRDG